MRVVFVFDGSDELSGPVEKEFDLPSVPRKGDEVTIDSTQRNVYHVEWWLMDKPHRVYVFLQGR